MSRGLPGGFTLVESVISLVLVSMALVAALSTVGQAARTRQLTADRALGQRLVQSMAAEITALSYENPDGLAGFGPESGEDAFTTITDLNGVSKSVPVRTYFDDVDDYHGWSSMPPSTRDGTQIREAAGWTRSVAVALAKPDDPNSNASGDAGAKRITVSATDGVTEVSIVFVRTAGR